MDRDIAEGVEHSVRMIVQELITMNEHLDELVKIGNIIERLDNAGRIRQEKQLKRMADMIEGIGNRMGVTSK